MPELSLAVGGVHVTTAVDTPSSVGWAISFGISEITGASLSEDNNIIGQSISAARNLKIDHKPEKKTESLAVTGTTYSPMAGSYFRLFVCLFLFLFCFVYSFVYLFLTGYGEIKMTAKFKC